MRLAQALTLADIQNLIDVKVIAGSADQITGINEIHKVVEGDLTFVDHPKYYKRSLNSAASVVLINTEEVDNPLGKTLLISDDPFRDYNTLVRWSHRVPVSRTSIHESAEIGVNTTVSQGVVIGAHVVIGEACMIHPNVVIYPHTVIGDRVTIHANAVLGGDAFYFKRRSDHFDKMLSCGRVVVENDVEIGAACTIDRGVSGDTIIGEHSKLDDQVHLGHGVEIGKRCLIAAQVGIAGKTIIGNDVCLWGQVGVNKSLRIGDGANIYAQSGVKGDIEGGKTYFGSPVQEAREKMKQLAAEKHLPELLKRVRELEKKLNDLKI